MRRPSPSRTGRPFIAAAVALVVMGCSAAPLEVPSRAAPSPAALPVTADGGGPASTGTAVVAYPEEPASFLAPAGADVAADDLAALWGLPLLRLDEAGQVRRGLVGDWTVRGAVEDGWQVVLDLRAGSWSDGSPVEASDVVATIRARRRADPGQFGAVHRVEALADGRVAVTFDRVTTSWASLLIELGTMLPAEQVAADSSRYDDALPVSGGWFRLAEYEPGLRARFEAHRDGPLGAPRLASVEVLFTPSFETALGFLEDDEVGAVLGYLALNGVPRATELDGVDAASPLGGTLVSLEFRADGVFGGVDQAARRRGVAETVDVAELVEGLLGPSGRRASSPWPGVQRPDAPPVGEVRERQQFVIAFPADHEVMAFTARSVQRDLVSRGMTVDLVDEPAPRFARNDRGGRDVALVVRRVPPRPSLAPWVQDVEVARAAAAAAPESRDALAGLAAVADLARTAPLFQVGVLHAWDGIAGIRPSAWPGIGFWNVGEWSTPDG